MQKLLFGLMLLILVTGCQPANLGENVPLSPESPPSISPMDRFETPETIPAPITSPQLTAEILGEYDNGVLMEGAQMPISLEVTQTTIVKTDSPQGPTIGVGPTIYFYNPDSKILLLHPTITLVTTTELLIGVNSVLQTPSQVYEKRAIIQYPSAQPDLIQLSVFDAETGTLNLVYDGEAFDLYPGESRTFKQVGSGDNPSTVVTIISNHGYLANIQEVLSDGSWR